MKGRFSLRIDAIRTIFFRNHGTFKNFSKKGRGGLPTPPPSCAPVYNRFLLKKLTFIVFPILLTTFWYFQCFIFGADVFYPLSPNYQTENIHTNWNEKITFVFGSSFPFFKEKEIILIKAFNLFLSLNWQKVLWNWIYQSVCLWQFSSVCCVFLKFRSMLQSSE